MRRRRLMENVKESYTAFHRRRDPQHVYPSEWVIRTLLGRYPRLGLDKDRYAGARILDVGFGDGRNWALLQNLGFAIHAIEITKEIVSLGNKRAKTLGADVTLKIGRNSSIPFQDNYFDYLLSSASCYYVDAGTTFSDNVQEYHRV